MQAHAYKFSELYSTTQTIRFYDGLRVAAVLGDLWVSWARGTSSFEILVT
jgi:hypothetical protein